MANYIQQFTEAMMDRWFPDASQLKSTTTNQGSQVTQFQTTPVFKDSSFSEATGAGYKSMNSLISSVTAAVSDRDSFLGKMEDIKYFDLVESIVQTIANDIFNKYYDKNIYKDFFIVGLNDIDGMDKEKEKEIEEELAKEIKKFDIYSVLKERIIDFLLYGEIIFKIDWEHKEIDDYPNSKKFTPLYVRDFPKYLIDLNNEKSKLIEAKDFLSFRLYSSVATLDMRDKSGVYFTTRLSRGIFSEGVIAKFITLNLLENMIPLVEVSNMSKKMYFYMKVPPGTGTQDAFKLSKSYERMLMTLLKMDNPKSIDDLLNVITKVKVVPLFGDNQEITQNDLAPMERIDLNYINDLRDSIATSMRIPKSFVSVSDDTNGANPEYIQMIMRIRESLGNGIKLFVLHYMNKHYPEYTVKMANIRVRTPRITGSDDLESIDYIQLLSQSVSDINTLVQNCIDTVDRYKDNDAVDVENLVDFFNEKLKALTTKSILKVPDSAKGNEESEDQDQDEAPSPNESPDEEPIEDNDETENGDEGGDTGGIKGLDTSADTEDSEKDEEVADSSMTTEVNT